MLKGKNYSSLFLDNGKDSSPVQLFFTDIASERALLKALLQNLEEKNGEKLSFQKLFERVKVFYRDVSKTLRDGISYTIVNDPEHPNGAVHMVKKNGFEVLANNIRDKYKSIFSNGFTIIPWYDEERPKTPDFHFTIETTLTDKKEKKIYLHACIPPCLDDFDTGSFKELSVAQMYAKQREFIYKYNQEASTNLSTVLQKRGDYLKECEEKGWNHFCQGELHCFYGVAPFTQQSPLQITDLLHDRIAARIQSFATACPVKEFDLEDTHKLTWAAFEIGKLIERQIAYRGNRSDDPMPLTALEFSKIPISDMSFVDNLRSRRTRLKEIGGNIDIYLKDVYFQMGMGSDIAYSSRIKEYRSYFDRMRERFDAYYRGNLALWAYLLFLHETKGTLLEKIHKEIEQFKNLVERLCPSATLEISKVGPEGMKELYGDLKFDAPLFLSPRDKPDGYENLLWEAVSRVTENLARETYQLGSLLTATTEKIRQKRG